MRVVMGVLMLSLFAGCSSVDRNTAPAVEEPVTQLDQPATVQPGTEPSVLDEPLMVRTQAVDLSRGMPRRVTSGKRDQAYPLTKGGFIYQDPTPWQRLRFDTKQPGRLQAVIDPSLLPASMVGRSIVEPEAPSPLCATAAIAAPLDAGPRQNWVTRRAHQLAGNLWQSLFGDEGEVVSSAIRVAPNPLAGVARQRFVPFAGVDPLVLDISGQVLSSGLLINVHLVESQGEPTFHYVYLEHRSCQRAWPDRYRVYQLWEPQAGGDEGIGQLFVSEQDETSLVLGRFVAASLDLSLSGVSKADDRGYLGEYQQNLLSQAPQPIWKQFGMDTPQRGVRALGSGFGAVTAAALAEDTVLVVHIVRPLDTRYVTDALLFRVRVNEAGTLSFTRL